MALSQQITKRWQVLKNERSHILPIWQDVTDYVNPFRGRYFVTNRNLRGANSKKILDSTPARSQRILSAGLMSGMTSPARPWFGLTTADPDLAKNMQVKSWCYDVATIMRRVFSKSNVYRVLHTIYDELGLFGTGPAIMNGHYDNIVHGYPLTAGEYCIATDMYGVVDTLYREFQMTVKALVEMFGKSCPSQVMNQYENGNYDTLFTVIHAIEPRTERNASSRKNTDMPFRSVYVMASGEVLRESGYKRFPVLAPRWDVLDDYGISPSMWALPDIKQLQIEQLRKGQGIDQQNNPTRLIPASLKNAGVNLLPGGVIYANAAEMATVRSAYEIRPDLSGLLADIADVRERINASFYTDLFMMFDQQTGQMTATEVAERQSEKMLMLGPVLERLDNELLSPLIEMTFDKMLEAGIVPPLPDELHGQEIVIEYTSVLAQAQKMTSANSQSRFLNSLGVMAQLKPDVLDKFDADAAVDDLADALGVNPKTIVSGRDVAMIRQQRAEQQAQQQDMMAQAAQAQTTKDMSQIDTQNLGEVMQQLQGYGGMNG